MADTTQSNQPYILQDTESNGSLEIPREALDSWFTYWEANDDLRSHFETGTDAEKSFFGIMSNLVSMAETVSVGSEQQGEQARS